jgi:hypothetical protein
MIIKLIKVFVIGLCVSVLAVDVSHAMYSEKQETVDKFIFEDHSKEIADKGIEVTHTVLVENVVEIGIIPYNKDNVDYFINELGEENVSIVEGRKSDPMFESTMQMTAVKDSSTQVVKKAEHVEEAAVNFTGIYFILSLTALLFVSGQLIRKKIM